MACLVDRCRVGGQLLPDRSDTSNVDRWDHRAPLFFMDEESDLGDTDFGEGG
jgi:hypothetical protein